MMAGLNNCFDDLVSKSYFYCLQEYRTIHLVQYTTRFIMIDIQLYNSKYLDCAMKYMNWSFLMNLLL